MPERRYLYARLFPWCGIKIGQEARDYEIKDKIMNRPQIKTTADNLPCVASGGYALTAVVIQKEPS